MTPSKRLRAAFRLALPLATLLSLAGCEKEAPPPTIDASEYVAPRVSASSYASRDVKKAGESIAFRDATAESGVNFTHATGAYGKKYMPETLGAGVALFDADNDGDLDLFLANSAHWSDDPTPGAPPTLRCAFYLNDGTGNFADATNAWGIDFSAYCMGLAAADYDGDGDFDLYVTSVGDNILLRNDGGKFVDAATEAGVAGGRWTDGEGRENAEWSTGAAWLDYDQDGLLDLFVANYVRWSPETDVFTTLVENIKSYASPVVYEGLSNRLYRNVGGGKFEDVTEAAGVKNDSGKSMSLALADFNADGWVDIVVTNDTQPNFLYQNLGDGTFEEIGVAAGVAYDEDGRARAGMGVDVADLDNSGRLSIVIGNFASEPLSLFALEGGNAPGEYPYFQDEAGAYRLTGPSLPSLTFPVLFADFDADGWIDLFAGNGHLEPDIEMKSSEIKFRQRPQLFHNQMGKGFVELGENAGEPFSRSLVIRGLACGDLDNDGDIDVVASQNGDKALVLMNESPGAAERAVRIRLKGKGGNTSGVGAMALFETIGPEGKAVTQRAMVRGASSYLSQSDLAISFGVPQGHKVGRVAIRWHGGEGDAQAFEGWTPGAEYRVAEGEAEAERIPFAAAK